MEQETTQKERPSMVGGKIVSRLRPPQISALTKNKFGFLKETTVAEKAEFEQLEKPESCKGIPYKTEQDLWKEMLGEPVCVGGIKKGILRYFGPTKFADGLWCGIELNDPIGKNDGTIDGVSYFNCKKQHGIFAPLSKVQHISSSNSLSASKSSNNVQQHSEIASLHNDTTQLIHKQSYIGVSESRIRTNSLKEPSGNTTFSTGHHNSIFSTGLRKPRDIRASSMCDQYATVGARLDATRNVNKNNLTIVTSKEHETVNDSSSLLPKSYLGGKKEQCYTTGKNHQYSDRSSKDCSTMNTTVNIEKPDLNSTFTMEDDFPHENEPLRNLDVLNTTFDLDSSSLNKNITQILPKKHTDQNMDLNTTFSFDDLCAAGKVNKECFNEIEANNYMQEKNNSSSLNKNITQILPKKCNDQTIDLNMTFSYDELNATGKASKEYFNEIEADSCLQEKVRKLSIDEVFNRDELDDDQQSLDLDESLGILTPNQMKDFTVCIDQQSVIMLDGSISRIPKISSCDNIDDIPEDEVRDTFSHLGNDGNYYTQVLTEDNLEHVLNSPSFSQTEGKTFVRLVHQFDGDNGREFSLDSRQTSTPCTGGKEIRDILSPISFSNIIDITSNVDKSAKKFNFIIENKQSENVELPISETCVAEERVADEIDKSYDGNIRNGCSHIEEEELPECSLLLNVSCSSEVDNNTNATKIIKQFTEETIRNKDIMSTKSEEKRPGECINLLKETSKGRNNSFNSSFDIIDTTKIISTDTVNVDKQICFETNEFFEPDVECLKTERPASTFTVGSTDTGYQEDGDFDARSELSVATQSPCSELPAHSMYSSNRSMGIEDNERHPVVEIMSDSDFFTDSGGIGFTESEIETDGECKNSNDFVQDNDRMCTVIEQNMSENEDTTNKTSPELDNSLDDQSVVLKPKAADETIVLQPSTMPPTSTTEINKIPTIEEDSAGKVNLECRSEEVGKSSKVEKINSFIIADKESDYHAPLGKNSISNGDKKVLLNNKTVTKTPPEVPRNKRDSVLKPKMQNENVISEKRVRKNVVSKIKLMIESSPSNLANKNDENNPKSNRLPKKSRWEDVTSKIAASMAVEKTKSKEKKEIKSRIDTNLLGAKPIPSRRGSKFDTRSKNENVSNVDGSAAKNLRNLNQRGRIQPPQHIDPEKIGNQETTNAVKKNQLKPSKSVSSTLSNASYSSSTSKQSSGVRNESRTIAGVKSNTAKQEMPLSARKTPFRLAVSQTGGRTTKRDGNQGRKNLPLTQKRPTFPNLDQKRPPLWASKTELSKEVQRLGALCEARTKELNLLKMQLRHATTGFEAFSVLVRYMSEDLDAFSHPKVAMQLKKTKEGLSKTLLQLKEYQDQLEDLKKHHAKEISNLTEKLSEVHDDELFDLKIQHTTELAEAKAQHEKKIAEIHETYKKTTVSSEQQYLQIVEELKREYVQQKQELEKSHAEQLSNAIQHHEDTKSQLLAQIRSLQDQYEELLEQAREMENALHKSSDSKMQWISLKKTELEKEVDSLKVVLEMKQSEIRTLRRENLEMKKELEELPIAKDRIQKLEAKREELEAIMEKKSRAQSVLSTEHEQLREYFEKESKFNKQLSMEKEELQWKLQQSLETTSLLSSLTESAHIENDAPAFPTRLSASYHAYTSRTSEKSSPHQSVTSSPYRPYRRSASLSDAAISSSKKFRHVLDNSPLTEITKRPSLRSHSLLKTHTSKHPKHRSFTLHSGKSFTDHVKSVENYEESSLQRNYAEMSGSHEIERKSEKISDNIHSSGSSSVPTGSSITFTSTPHAGTNSNLPVHHFELTRPEDTSPIVKLFQNQEQRDGRAATSTGHSFNANNLKLIQMEYEKNMPLQRQVEDYATKESQPEFVVVLETSNNIAAYKANTEQTEDGGLEDVSKLSDSIEGSFTSPPDILDNSNNVSCSLQSSIISDDSAWSSTSFPPQAHFDVRSHDFVSPSSEDDSFSNSSGGSHGNRAVAAEGLNVSCGEQDESSSSVEHSRCVEGNCQYRSFSPKHLAGEAMVQDDSAVSAVQTSEELSVSVSRRKHKQRRKSEITEEDTSKETWEISCYGLKERVVQSNNMDSPSMETTSQGHLMTNSNIDDLSWDSEDMPSEPEE